MACWAESSASGIGVAACEGSLPNSESSSAIERLDLDCCGELVVIVCSWWNGSSLCRSRVAIDWALLAASSATVWML
jgi:hypothetical protein